MIILLGVSFICAVYLLFKKCKIDAEYRKCYERAILLENELRAAKKLLEEANAGWEISRSKAKKLDEKLKSAHDEIEKLRVCTEKERTQIAHEKQIVADMMSILDYRGGR